MIVFGLWLLKVLTAKCHKVRPLGDESSFFCLTLTFQNRNGWSPSVMDCPMICKNLNGPYSTSVILTCLWVSFSVDRLWMMSQDELRFEEKNVHRLLISRETSVSDTGAWNPCFRIGSSYSEGVRNFDFERQRDEFGWNHFQTLQKHFLEENLWFFFLHAFVINTLSCSSLNQSLISVMQCLLRRRHCFRSVIVDLRSHSVLEHLVHFMHHIIP